MSSASVNGDYLVVESNKFYNQIKADKEDWPELVKFLNAANKFNEQKVLLKKKVDI